MIDSICLSFTALNAFGMAHVLQIQNLRRQFIFLHLTNAGWIAQRSQVFYSKTASRFPSSLSETLRARSAERGLLLVPDRRRKRAFRPDANKSLIVSFR
jgi:hypothetical protein